MFFDCELPDGTAARIPEWLADPSRCAAMDSGEPVAAIEALENLYRLLEAAGRVDASVGTTAGTIVEEVASNTDESTKNPAASAKSRRTVATKARRTRKARCPRRRPAAQRRRK